MILRRKYIQVRETALITAEWLFLFQDIHTGKVWSMGPFRNKVVQGGLNNMAALWIGEVPSDTAAMHLVIGDSVTPALISDNIANMGEVVRKSLAAKNRTGSLARHRAFFQATEANGNHQCVGVLARSTDLPGSGVLLNRLVQPFSKAANMVLTVEVKWNFQGVSN